MMNNFEHRSAESVVIFEERVGFVRGGGQVGDYGIHQRLHTNISRTRVAYRSKKGKLSAMYYSKF